MKQKVEPREGQRRSDEFYERILWYAKPPPTPHPVAFMVYLQMRFRLITASKNDPDIAEVLAYGDLVVRATPKDLRDEMAMQTVPLRMFRDSLDSLRQRGWIEPWGVRGDLWILGKNWRPYAVDTLPASDELPPGPLKETTT